MEPDKERLTALGMGIFLYCKWCKKPLFGKQRDFCCRKHKDKWHAWAMQIGHVIQNKAERSGEPVQRLIAAAGRVNSSYDINAMLPTERLKLLVQTAVRIQLFERGIR